MGGMAQGGANPFASLLGALGQQGGFGGGYGVGGAPPGGFGGGSPYGQQGGFGGGQQQASVRQNPYGTVPGGRFGQLQAAARTTPGQAQPRGAQRFGNAVRGQQQQGGAAPPASLLSQVGMSNLQRGVQQQQGFQQAQAGAQAKAAADQKAAQEKARMDAIKAKSRAAQEAEQLRLAGNRGKAYLEGGGSASMLSDEERAGLNQISPGWADPNTGGR